MGAPRTSDQADVSRVDVGLSLAITLLALIPRYAGLSAQRFIDDECFHADLARWSMAEIWQHSTTSVTMPGWFVPYRLWTAWVVPLFGDADLGARAFSLLAGCLVVTTTYWLGLLAAGRRVAVLAGLAVALSGYQIYFSQTATPYAVLCLLGPLTALSLVICLRHGSRLAAVANALILGSTFYVHHSAALLWGAQAVAILLLLLARVSPRRHLILAAAASVGALVLAAPALRLWLTQAQVLAQVGLPYVPALTAAAVGEVLYDLAAYRSRLPLGVGLVVLFACAALIPVARAAVGMFRSAGPKRPWLVVVGCVALLPLGVSLLAGLLIADYFWYAPRYFALFQAVWAVLLAVAVANLGGNLALGKVRHVLALALALAFLAPQVSSIIFLNDEARTRENFPIDEVGAYLKAQSQPGDTALVHHSWYTLHFQRYYRHPHPGISGAITPGIKGRVFGGTLEKASPASVEETLAPLKTGQHVFLILPPTKNSEGRDPHGLLEQTMDQRLELKGSECFACDTGDPVRVKRYKVRFRAAPSTNSQSCTR